MLINIFRPKKTNREKGVFERDLLATLEVPEDVVKEYYDYNNNPDNGDPYFLDKKVEKLKREWENIKAVKELADERIDDMVFILWLSHEKGWKLQDTYEMDLIH